MCAYVIISVLCTSEIEPDIAVEVHGDKANTSKKVSKGDMPLVGTGDKSVQCLGNSGNTAFSWSKF